MSNLCVCAEMDWYGVDYKLEHHPDCPEEALLELSKLDAMLKANRVMVEFDLPTKPNMHFGGSSVMIDIEMMLKHPRKPGEVYTLWAYRNGDYNKPYTHVFQPSDRLAIPDGVYEYLTVVRGRIPLPWQTYDQALSAGNLFSMSQQGVWALSPSDVIVAEKEIK